MTEKSRNLHIQQIPGDIVNLGALLVHAMNVHFSSMKTVMSSTKCGISGIGPLVEWGIATWTDDPLTCLECIAKGAT